LGLQRQEGRFYPEELSDRDRLRFFATTFPTVEINNQRVAHAA
jgi:uncharacterized protein YecE (DUF72 family)